MKTTLWWAALVPMLVLPQVVLGADSAEKAAQEYAAAMGAEDFGRALALVRPADLKDLAGTLREVLSDPVYGANLRREVGSPDMKPKSLSDAEIMGQIFKSAYVKFREMGVMGPDKLKISLLGSVPENANTVHYVQKAEVKGPERSFSQITLVSVAREGKEWYVLFPESLRQQASSFADQLKQATDHADMGSAQ